MNRSIVWLFAMGLWAADASGQSATVGSTALPGGSVNPNVNSSTSSTIGNGQAPQPAAGALSAPPATGANPFVQQLPGAGAFAPVSVPAAGAFVPNATPGAGAFAPQMPASTIVPQGATVPSTGAFRSGAVTATSLPVVPGGPSPTTTLPAAVSGISPASGVPVVFTRTAEGRVVLITPVTSAPPAPLLATETRTVLPGGNVVKTITVSNPPQTQTSR